MDVFIIHRSVKRDVLCFTRPSGTKKCILLCESRQDFLEFFVMYKTEIPRVNGMKDVQREVIELCAIFR